MPSAQSVINKRKKDLTNIDVVKFPKHEMAHFTTILFTEYQRLTLDDVKALNFGKLSKSLRASSRSPDADIPKGSIVLPIPANLQENFGANYQGTEFGTFGTAQNLVDRAKEGQSVTSMAGDAAADALKGLASIVSPAGADKMKDRALGDIKNPNLASTFSGVNLRTHNFSWRLSPTTVKESYDLKRIIDTIRHNMLPPRVTANRMGYPNECFVQFHGDGYGIYPMFKCVVTNMTVNHAAAGTPVFFGTTGMPAEIELNIQLQETEVVMRDDIPDPAELDAAGGYDSVGLYTD